MGQTTSYQKVFFRLEIIPYAENSIMISAVLNMLINVFRSLRKRYVEIYVSPSVKYRLVGNRFVKMDYSSTLTTEEISCATISFNDIGPIFWEGFIELDSSKLEDQLQRLSERLYQCYSVKYQFSVRLSLDRLTTKSNPFDTIRIPTRSTHDSYKCKLFSMGNIINGNRFISRFASIAIKNTLHCDRQNRFKDISIAMLHHRKQFNLLFTVMTKGTSSERKYKLVYEYSSIKQATISSLSLKDHFLYLTTSQPPKIFVEKCCKKKNLCSNGWTRWYDCDLIPQDTIGKNSVLRLLVADFHPIVQSLHTVRRFLNDQRSVEIYFGHIRSYFVHKSYEICLRNLPFEVKYGIASVNSITNAFQDDLDLNRTGEIFCALIKSFMVKGKTKILVGALNQLFYDYLAGKVINGYNHFENLVLNIDTNGLPDEPNTKYIKFLRMAILTPTRLILTPPTEYRTSLFYDKTDPDHILRVVMRDDDSSNLSFAVKRKPENLNGLRDYDGEFLKKIVQDRLLETEDGFIVADRLFSYYGASSSQLREGGMVFYAKDEKNQSAASLRAALGPSDEIPLSKYIARVGLSLSQLDGLVDLPKDIKIFTSPDIVGGSHPDTGKPYNFTDGCGKISVSLARFIYNDLKSQGIVKDNDDLGEDHLPSAFQIRFMNAKGMVMVDPSLKGNIIVLTKSMIKMNGRPEKIGIIKMSEPKEAYLNRPFVANLFEIGLKVEVIMKYLIDTLKGVTNCFHDNQASQFMLEKYSEIGQFIKIKDFAEAGFKLHGNSFIASALSLISIDALQKIKTKQRIILHKDKARTMFGLADPTAKCPMELAQFDKKRYMKSPGSSTYPEGLGTGALKEGEVFIWPSEGNFPEPLVGDVLVTKFPCYAPGDIRQLKAVNCPELFAKKIKDCIVFAVAGDRPEFDKMGGSDLDGDEYCVIWEKDFLSLNIQPPLSFPDHNKESQIKEKTPEKMVEYQIKNLRQNKVGSYCTRLFAYTDRFGANNELCKALAIECSVAIDGAKHDTENDFKLTSKNASKLAPDVLEKWLRTPTYHSAKAPGAVYQYVSLFEIFQSTNQNDHQSKLSSSSLWNVKFLVCRLQYVSIDEFVQKYGLPAMKAFKEYEQIVDQLLHRLAIASEVELFTLINTKKSNFSEWVASGDRDDSQILIVKNTLIERMDQIFNEGMNGTTDEEKMIKAFVFYMVSTDPKFNDQVKLSRANGLAFFGECGKNLLKLMMRNRTGPMPLIIPSIKPSIHTNQNFSDDIILTISLKIKIWAKQIFKYNSEGMKKLFAERVYCQLIKEIVKEYFAKPKNLLENLSLMINAVKHLHTDETDQERQFGCYNNPLGQMIMVLLLKIELDRSELTKTSDSIEMKSILIIDSHEHVKAIDLIECLKEMFPSIVVMKGSTEKKNCIPVTIEGSKAKILGSQIVIGLHNLCSSI